MVVRDHRHDPDHRDHRYRSPLLLDRCTGILAVVGLDLLRSGADPFFMMTVFAFNMVNRRRRNHPNKAADPVGPGHGGDGVPRCRCVGLPHTCRR